MNRYWNFTEKQRSEMTGDQVRSFLDVELMEKGVAKVAEVKLQTIEEIVLPKTEYFGVKSGQYSSDDTGFVFATMEQAMAFIAACPMKKDYNWDTGTENHFASLMENLMVSPVQLPTKAAVSNAAVVLKRNTAAKSANEKLVRSQKEAEDKIEKATSGVWDDWNECQEKAARCDNVKATREEYMNLCDDNATMAEAFLGKVFTAEQIKESNEWFAE